MHSRVRNLALLAGLGLVLVSAFLLSMFVGSTWVSPRRIVQVLMPGSAETDSMAFIIERVRMPRALTALLAGASLGVAGLQMQTLFRNPLADPSVLGVSSGASFGVALVVLGTGYGAAAAFGVTSGLAGDVLVTVAAMIGASLALSLVLLVSSQVTSPATVLVLGLMCGYGVSAVVTILVGVSQPERLQQWAQWGFGSFSGVTWPRLAVFAPLVLVGLSGATLTTKQLNALLFGERYAMSMGVAVRRARLVTMLGAALLGAIVTAFCGPIAFLGIAVPHLCRGLFRTSDHRVLVPAVVLMGGIVALVAQTLSVLPGSAGVLPINAVTALLGAPVVVAVLLRRGTWAVSL